MEVVCDYCSVVFNYKGGISHFNRSKTHHCSQQCQIKNNTIHGMANKDKSKRDKRYKIWCNVKKRAKLKGITFNIKPSDIKLVDYCPILNIKIEPNNISGPIDSSPSLDRIDSQKGYVVGNIRIISNRANRIKSDATYKELGLIYSDLKNIMG